MTTFVIYAVGAAALVAIGLHGAVRQPHLLRQILALNVMGGGVFLLFITIAYRNAAPTPDPVPHALVLTGIVVAVSVSAFAVALARSIHARTGRISLKEEEIE